MLEASHTIGTEDPSPRGGTPTSRLAAALVAAVALAASAGAVGCQPSRAPGERPRAVRVLAAASARAAVEELAQGATPRVTVSFGPSGSLARQIEAGQPADVFLSADPRWTDWLVSRGLLRADAVRPVASNRLVVVAAPSTAGAAHRWDPAQGGLAARAASERWGRWTTADPATGPLGRYAKAALTTLGPWDALKPSLIPARDAAAALRLVQDGHVGWGVVYQTDAQAAPELPVVATLPAALHPPILYVAAALPGAPPAARVFVEALAGPRGRAAFRAAGFRPPPEAPE